MNGPIVKFTTSIHPQPTGFFFWYSVKSTNYIFTRLVYQRTRLRVLAENIDDVEKIPDSVGIFRERLQVASVGPDYCHCQSRDKVVA